MDAHVEEARVEARLGRAQHHVAHDATLTPAPTAGPLTAATVGSGQFCDRLEPAVHVAEGRPRVEQVVDRTARAEHRRCGGDDERTDALGSPDDLGHRGLDLFDHLERQRVAPAGIVEGEDRDIAVAFQLDELVVGGVVGHAPHRRDPEQAGDDVFDGHCGRKYPRKWSSPPRSSRMVMKSPL